MRGMRGWRHQFGPLAALALLAFAPSPSWGDDSKSGDQAEPGAVVEQPRDEASLRRPPDDGAPKLARDEAEIRAWIEARKGYGYPQYLDSAAAAPDMRVLAAWNIPTSGVNFTDFWVYCQEPTGGWRLLESGWFPPPEDQAHSAVLDQKTAEVRFLGKDGAVYHRVPVEGCKQKRP